MATIRTGNKRAKKIHHREQTMLKEFRESKLILDSVLRHNNILQNGTMPKQLNALIEHLDEYRKQADRCRNEHSE